MTALQFIEADWPAPANVRALCTTRGGGVSAGAFASLNLATHVGDDAAAVAENRARLGSVLRLDAEPLWLEQVHGTFVADAATVQQGIPVADAAVCAGKGRPCVIMTADCLPVVFCDRAGTRVGAAHAGWRGLAGGVLGATIDAMSVEPQSLLAWLGPAIEQEAFEVGEEVRAAFMAQNPATAVAFTANARGRWQADLYALARFELARLGVQQVYGGGFSCFADARRFFSYRRDKVTGRMATLVCLT